MTTTLRILDESSAHGDAKAASGALRPGIDQAAEADLSRCGALADFWYVASLASELGRDKPLGRTVFGVRLALFRDQTGTARAVRDRCLHRAAALSKGAVVHGLLCCPYHGWSYGGDGQCLHVPSDEDRPPAGSQCLKSYPTREQDGLIYVYVGSPPGPRKEPFQVPYWNDKSWTSYYMVTPFKNGITNLVENFMDVPHTVYVHEGWFRNRARRKVPATVDRTPTSVLVTYHEERDRIAGLGFVLDPSGRQPMVHTDKFYIPNVTRVDYTFGNQSGFIITSQCTPVGATESLVYTAISYRLPFDIPGSVVARALRPLMRWYTTQVIRQDVAIMEVQRQGLLGEQEDDPIRFGATDADALHEDIEALRGWLLQGGAGSPPSPRSRTIDFWI